MDSAIHLSYNRPLVTAFDDSTSVGCGRGSDRLHDLKPKQDGWHLTKQSDYRMFVFVSRRQRCTLGGGVGVYVCEGGEGEGLTPSVFVKYL